jgi:hypothetical protein
MTMIVAKALGVSLGFDTSENLTAAQYQALKSKGFDWAVRYVPRADQSTTGAGVIQPAELAAALDAGLGMMLVQFSRGSGWTASSGNADGQWAAQYARVLGVPNTVCLWADMGVPSTAQVSADYLNGWYAGAVGAGWDPAALGVYFEPGNPMTASQRYSMLKLARYWATAADDPQRFPQPRGCQLVQLWASSAGEYSPLPGVVIDGDVAQLDWLEHAPVAAFRG